MWLNCFAGLFRKRCPLCRQEVHAHETQAVQQFGRWFCSKVHADLYEWELYEALHTVHCQHAGCHGEHAPLSSAVNIGGSTPKEELAPLRKVRAECPMLFP
jgi:hypothetical protein